MLKKKFADWAHMIYNDKNYGKPYDEITSAESFPSYEEAEAYISGQESDNYKIVGTNPLVSPVPIEALKHYRLIYSSDSSIMKPNVGMISEVKIFEYIGH